MTRNAELRAWAAQHGLSRSHATSDPVAWLLGRRTRTFTTPQWFDHGTRWTRHGEPYCLLGQPYQLDGDDLRELANIESALGLAVCISPFPARHRPGDVLSVIVTRSRV
jgi:hypothetical protein